MNSSDQPSLHRVYPAIFPSRLSGGSLPRRLPVAASLEHGRQEFAQAVLAIVKRHAPDFNEANLEARISKRNTYLSLTCTIHATSRAQLDALYQELCDHPMVTMVL